MDGQVMAWIVLGAWVALKLDGLIKGRKHDYH